MVPELCADVSRNTEIGNILPFLTSGDLTFDLVYKMASVFVLILSVLSNALTACRYVAQEPGQGGGVSNIPQQRVGIQDPKLGAG